MRLSSFKSWSRTQSPFWLVITVSFALWTLVIGCGGTVDLAAERHAKAVKALLNLGADVRDEEDEASHEHGTFVILFAEHLTRDGRIEDRILVLIRDIQSCFLGLNNTPVTDAAMPELARLQELRLLNLHNTKITDDGVALIAKSKQIRLLKLSRSQVTDAGVAHLTEMPSLKMVYLGESSVTDEGLQHLTKIPQLEAIKLSQLPISDVGVRLLATMPRLRFLGLDDTNISDAGLALLTNLPNLAYLDLQDTAVSTAAVKAFQKKSPKCRVDY